MVKEYKDWLFVKVPEDATDWVIKKWPDHDVLFFLDVEREPDWIELPPGFWQIIGKVDAIDWEGIVDEVNHLARSYLGNKVFPDYTLPQSNSVADCRLSPTESGHSLLKSLNMEPGTVLVLKKNEK